MPFPDATTDFGEIVPPMLWASCSRVVSEGGWRTVVVADARVVVVAFGRLSVVFVVARVDEDDTFASDDFEPPPAARVTTATTRTTATQAAATTVRRAPGPLAGPGVATIAPTLPRGSGRSSPGVDHRTARTGCDGCYLLWRESPQDHE
jgi:hypothetical protein